MRLPELRLHPQLPAITGSLRHRLNVLFILQRRRIAAVAAALAAGLTVQTIAAGPPGKPVLAAAADYPAGAVIGQVREVWLPKGALWSGLSTQRSEIVGQVAAHALVAGEPISQSDLVGDGLLAGLPSGSQAVPVQVTPQLATLIRAGQHVDAYIRDSLGTRSKAATNAIVLAVLSGGSGGLFGSANTVTVLLGTTSTAAASLAGAEAVTLTLVRE